MNVRDDKAEYRHASFHTKRSTPHIRRRPGQDTEGKNNRNTRKRTKTHSASHSFFVSFYLRYTAPTYTRTKHTPSRHTEMPRGRRAGEHLTQIHRYTLTNTFLRKAYNTTLLTPHTYRHIEYHLSSSSLSRYIRSTPAVVASQETTRGREKGRHINGKSTQSKI